MLDARTEVEAPWDRELTLQQETWRQWNSLRKVPAGKRLLLACKAELLRRSSVVGSAFSFAQAIKKHFPAYLFIFFLAIFGGW
jgi:hypothetical protein